MKGIKQVWMLVIFLLLVGMVSANIVLDNHNYQPGEIVTIGLNYTNLSIFSLQITTDSRAYDYDGTLLPELSFLPQEEGNHTVLLRNQSNEIVDQDYFWVGDLSSGNESQNQSIEQNESVEGNETPQNESVEQNETASENTTILSKNTYNLEETVIINLTGINFTSLELEFLDETYTFLGEGDTAMFVPQEVGNYTVIVGLSDGEINESFIVVSNETEYPEPLLQIVRIGENVTSAELNRTTNIELFLEYPQTVKTDMEVPVRIILLATQNTTYNLSVREIIPEGWEILSYPEEVIIEDNVLDFFIAKIVEDKLYSFEYTMKSTNQTLLQEFELNLSYINTLNITNKQFSKTINVSANGSYFDVEIDLYDKNEEVTKEIKVGYTYDSKIFIRNLGDSVTEFETYFDWDYDESQMKVIPKGHECKVMNEETKYLRCEFPTFLKNETKEVRLKIKALEEGINYVKTRTLYDPPKGFMVRFWNGIKGFFVSIFQSLEGGLTGHVVEEKTLSEDSIITVIEEIVEDEPLAQLKKVSDKKVNVPPKIEVSSLPKLDLDLDRSEYHSIYTRLLQIFITIQDESFEKFNSDLKNLIRKHQTPKISLSSFFKKISTRPFLFIILFASVVAIVDLIGFVIVYGFFKLPYPHGWVIGTTIVFMGAIGPVFNYIKSFK